jgi:uncharacterized membrane protein YqiK
VETLLYLFCLWLLMVVISASGLALLSWLWERRIIRERRTRALAADPTLKGSGKGSGGALPSLRVLLMLAVGEHSHRSAVRVLGLR